MCGISGLANCGDKETLARMTSIQAHRGPDDSGLWEQRFPDGSYFALGSRRLAILDLSPDGHMPLSGSSVSTFAVVCFAERREPSPPLKARLSSRENMPRWRSARKYRRPS